MPTAGIIDSQTVRGADTVGAATSGYDAGKKTKGRKRHIAVDSNGWLLAVLVTAASVQDRDAGHRLLALLRERLSTITLVWADSGYAGRLVLWARTVLTMTVTVVKRTNDVRGFVVLPRRWVVERTFGWLARHRRLVRDYERRPDHHEAMIWWATTAIMTRQLDLPPVPWRLGYWDSSITGGSSGCPSSWSFPPLRPCAGPQAVSSAVCLTPSRTGAGWAVAGTDRSAPE